MITILLTLYTNNSCSVLSFLALLIAVSITSFVALSVLKAHKFSYDNLTWEKLTKAVTNNEQILS